MLSPISPINAGTPERNPLWRPSAVRRALFLVCLAYCARAGAGEITYSIQTVAGSSFVGDGGSALNAQLNDAQGLAIDRLGNVYIADPANHRVRKVNTAGIVQTVAGLGLDGFSGDGGPATQARLNAPYGVAVDAAGNLYIADLGNNRVRKVSPDGLISTVAGAGQPVTDGDGGKATAASLHAPRNVAVDAAGNLYIAEFLGHRIRQVLPDGLIQTIAGTGTAGRRGEGIAAISAELAYPAGMAVDFTGTLYIADSGNQRIRAVFNGIINTLPLSGAQLPLPTGVASDGTGGIYIADGGKHRIYRRTASGAMFLIAGAGAARAGFELDSARDVAIDGLGNLFIADGHRVRLLSSTGSITTFTGDGTFGFRGDGGAAALALLNGPSSVAVDADGGIYIADQGNHRVRKVSTAGIISTAAGGGSLSIGPPTSISLNAPNGLFSDAAGSLWLAEYYGQRVWRLTASGSVARVAGIGYSGFGGDAGPAALAELQTPSQTALDPDGNLYIADSGNNRIRKVSLAGTITTFAGTGLPGFGGDGGQASSAQLSFPQGIAFDTAGNLYIADTYNHRIRKVTPGGLITTLAGGGTFSFNAPRSVAVDQDLNVYIADTGNQRIVKLAASGSIAIIAGLGSRGFSGDGGDGLAAEFSTPAGIALDSKGNLYVADFDNNRIRKLTPSTIVVSSPVTQLSPASLLHAASLRAGPVAPGQILSIFADGIGPAAGVYGVYGPRDILDTMLSETQVLFDGRAAPLIYVERSQINVQVPYAVAGRAGTHVEVFHAGVRKVDATLLVTAAAPGIFTSSGGTGPALVTNQDGSLNGAANPAEAGSLITLYATGEGQTDGAGIDGKRSTEPYPQPVAPVALRLGGRPAEILFAAEAPGLAGMLQINARVPAIVAAGAVPLSLSIGAATSQDGVTVFIK